MHIYSVGRHLLGSRGTSPGRSFQSKQAARCGGSHSTWDLWPQTAAASLHASGLPASAAAYVEFGSASAAIRVAGGTARSQQHPDALGALGLQRQGCALPRPDTLPASHLR
jgi:hypothetical protein